MITNASGQILIGCKVTFFLSGTSTPTSVYTDSALTVPVLTLTCDGAGRLPPFYLKPGTSLKEVVADASSVTQYTVDPMPSVPSSASSQDVPVTAGATITTGQVVYLSDGSGGNTPGQWYPASATNAYSSVTPEIGIALAGIASGLQGTIRTGGQATGLSSLTVGAFYYIGATAGTLTTTAPTNARLVGQADSSTSLILPVVTVPNADNAIDDFRVTASTGVPAPAVDVTAATTIYATPYRGNRIALYDSNGFATVYISAEFSIAVPATTSQTYTVMAFASSGVPTLELATWTNDTTPGPGACVLTTTGTWTKSGDLTRRCLALMRTTTVSGQTEDSLTKRYVWNYHNRVYRPLQRLESTATWPYTTNTIHQANASAANQVDVVIGVQDAPVRLVLNALASNSTGTIIAAGIGLDSTTTFVQGAGMAISVTAGFQTQIHADLMSYPGVGRHFFSWNEWSTVAGTTTWSGLNATLTGVTMGLTGGIEGE